MKRLKEAILLAAKIREDSYDHKMSDELEKSKGYKNFSKCYKKSIYAAAVEASEKLDFGLQAIQPIFLLLTYAWNDILAWAEE